MASNLEILSLGGLQIKQNGAPVASLLSSKVPALLAYLAVTGRPHQRDALAGLLWGEMPDAAAANNLRQVLSNLRKLCGAHLEITRDTVAFDRTAPHFLDAESFLDLLRLSEGQPGSQRIGLLRQALALYQGDFLEGFYVRDAPDFEDWALVQRVHLRERALHGWEMLTGLLLDCGDYSAASMAAGRLLAMDPWREEAHRQRMLALARSGQRSAALAQYQACRKVLRQEFDAEPSAETTALFQRIRSSGQGPRHNLPAATTGFVGREQELAELRRLLAAPDTRLLTILGPGGVGKTRLAVEAAYACQTMFLNGVWLAQLAGVDDPALLPWALAEAVNCPLTGTTPPEAQLLDFLRGKELLLALDNFEHLITPASLDLLGRILHQAPDVTLLVTSRARLGLVAERLFPLAGLDYPAGPNGDSAAYPAVELLLRRAQRVRPDFELTQETTSSVIRLCQMTEGLPLALELAAAWTWSLTPAEIVAELEAGLAKLASSAADLPPRHRSLTALFEPSWRLLDAGQAATLAQLALFRGGFDRAAAAAVAGATLATLQTLTERSLLRVDAESRYDMHLLVQQGAAEKLAAEPATKDAARGRHAAYFAGLVQRHEHEFHGADDRQALSRMIREAANIRAAWGWAVDQAEPATLESFLESFLYFFDIQGRYAECVELTGQAIQALQDAARAPAGRRTGVSRALGRTLALHAAFQFRLGAFEIARQRAEEALALLEPLRPLRDVGHARLYLGAAWYGLGDLEQAVTWFLAAAQAYEESGHPWGIGAALDNAGFLELLRGNPATARSHLTRGLEIAQQAGSRYLLTGLYDHLATLAAAQNEFAAALDYVNRCQEVLAEMDRPYIVASLSLSLSKIALQAGDLSAARAHVERALQVARDTGNRLDQAQFLLQGGAVAQARADIPAARAAYGEAAAVAQAIQAEGLLAEAMEALARIS